MKLRLAPLALVLVVLLSGCAAMLERSDLDLIDIASPNRFHVEQALAALEHGKHVIVEKPAAVTRGDVQRLIDAARANGVYFFEAITTLFMPQYEACRLLLPKLGRIEQAHITYAQYSSRYDAYLRGENPNIFNPAMQAGALNDMGVYCVHMAVDLFGVPQDVRYLAELGPNGIDLAGRLTLTYPSLTCEILTAKNADLGSGCRITGENGQEQFVSYDNAGLQPQAQGEISGVDMGYRVPEFDISVQAQKQTAYTTMAQNELALQFYQLGFFNPQQADQTLMCLDMMEFRGKEDVVAKIRRMGTLYDQMQMLLQYAATLAQKAQDAGALAQLQSIAAGMGGQLAQGQPVEMPGGDEESGHVQKARSQARAASQPEGGA